MDSVFPVLKQRRFKQQRRRRLILLFNIQLLCFCHCVWTVSSQETESRPAQSIHHQHRQRLLPHLDSNYKTQKEETEDDYDQATELSNVEQDKPRRHRSLLYDDIASRSLRRKEVPVNYRLYDDLLRSYNKAARPVRHPSQIVSYPPINPRR